MIKGLSDKRSAERIGKIRVGEKKNGYPAGVDYFIFVTDRIQPEVISSVFGQKPKNIKIQFLYGDPDQDLSQYLKVYNKRGQLVCKGDGIVATWTGPKEKIPATGEILQSVAGNVPAFRIVCAGDICPLSIDQVVDGKKIVRQCMPTMNAIFRIPELEAATGVFGVWQLDTHSKAGIISFNTAYSLGRTFANSNNVHVSSVMFEMSVKIETSSSSGQSKKFPVVRLMCLNASSDLPAAKVPALAPPPDRPEESVPAEAADDDQSAAPQDGPATNAELKELFASWKRTYVASVLKAKLKDQLIADLVEYANKNLPGFVSIKELTSSQVADLIRIMA